MFTGNYINTKQYVVHVNKDIKTLNKLYYHRMFDHEPYENIFVRTS